MQKGLSEIIIIKKFKISLWTFNLIPVSIQMSLDQNNHQEVKLGGLLFLESDE